MLNQGGVSELSLDHDLGDPETEVGTGYLVATWLELQAYGGRWSVVPKTIAIRNTNPKGRANVQAVIDRIDLRRQQLHSSSFAWDTEHVLADFPQLEQFAQKHTQAIQLDGRACAFIYGKHRAEIDWERVTAAEKQFIATLEYFGNKAAPIKQCLTGQTDASKSEHEARLEEAITLWDAGEISLGQAAKMADRSLEEIMDEIGKRKLPIVRYSAEDIDEEVDTFLGPGGRKP